MAWRLDGAKPLSEPMLGYCYFGPLGSNFGEIIIEIDTFSFKKMHLKLSSAKWRPFYLGLNVLYWRCDGNTTNLINLHPSAVISQTVRILFVDTLSSIMTMRCLPMTPPLGHMTTAVSAEPTASSRRPHSVKPASVGFSVTPEMGEESATPITTLRRLLPEVHNNKFYVMHWNWIVFNFTKFSSLAPLEVVILTKAGEPVMEFFIEIHITVFSSPCSAYFQMKKQ